MLNLCESIRDGLDVLMGDFFFQISTRQVFEIERNT